MLPILPNCHRKIWSQKGSEGIQTAKHGEALSCPWSRTACRWGGECIVCRFARSYEMVLGLDYLIQVIHKERDYSHVENAIVIYQRFGWAFCNDYLSEEIPRVFQWKGLLIALFFAINIQCWLDVNLFRTGIDDKIYLMLRLLFLAVNHFGYFDYPNVGCR